MSIHHGRTVCFTGKGYTDTKTTQPRLRSRAAWSEMADSMGMKVVPKVTALTHYVVASTFGTVKAREAHNLGIKVLSYDDFQRMFDDVVRGAGGGVTAQGVDLSDPMDDGSLGYDPLAAAQAAYDAARRAGDREDAADARRRRKAAEKAARDADDLEAKLAAEDEAIPGWGMF